MLQLPWAIAALIHRYLRWYAPSNILIDRLRTRQSLKWTLPAALLLVPALL